MTLPGRRTIEFLIGRNRLEHIDPTSAAASGELVLARAERRLLTAAAGLAAGDHDGAFAASYDAYRMAAESLLIRQGLRATGGDGSHMTVEDAIGAQFADRITEFAKPTFERLRRTRHMAQYFDPSASDITDDDAGWALAVAQRAVAAVRRLVDDDPPPVFG